MDFTNDASMGLFTEGQKNVMRAQFGANGKRNSFLNSKGLTSAWNNTQVQTNQTSTPQVSIYPNPVITGNISISLNGLDNSGKHFAIVAANGQIVKTGYFNQAKVEVNVSHFAAGIYHVRLTDVGSNLFAKFVKQ
jgi:plastocyanin domain-containing protein